MTTENSNASDNGDQIWFVDHQQLDVPLINSDGEANNKRPWLTIVLNGGGKVIASCLSFDSPTQEQIERLLDEAKLAEDTPCDTESSAITLYTDSGAQFSGLDQRLSHMNIEVVRSAPGKPWGRGVVERTFKTLSTSQ